MIVPIREKVKKGQVLSGTVINLGSPVTAEIAGNAGFDWLMIDCEHGAGDHTELLGQLQGIACTPAAAIVRIAWNEAPRFKRALDLGADGIMIPVVDTAEQARQAVSAMRYPPMGTRGASANNRACGWGATFQNYFATANDQLLTVAQIETPLAVENADAIAAVDGVDVLFVGPMDLTVCLGCMRQWDNPVFKECLVKVAAACKAHGKAAGILLLKAEQIEPFVEMGYTFIALGSDGGSVQTGLKTTADAFAKFRTK